METANTETQPIENINQPPQTGEIVLAVPPEPKFFYYLLSFLVFPFGIFLGMMYLRKNGLVNKAFGMRTLIMGLSLPAILLVIAVISFILL